MSYNQKNKGVKLFIYAISAYLLLSILSDLKYLYKGYESLSWKATHATTLSFKSNYSARGVYSYLWWLPKVCADAKYSYHYNGEMYTTYAGVLFDGYGRRAERRYKISDSEFMPISAITGLYIFNDKTRITNLCVISEVELEKYKKPNVIVYVNPENHAEVIVRKGLGFLVSLWLMSMIFIKSALIYLFIFKMNKVKISKRSDYEIYDEERVKKTRLSNFKIDIKVKKDHD